MALSTVTMHYIETALASLPLYQYAFFAPEEIVFNERLRTYCGRSCRHFKTAWSCPPAIEPVERCIERCLSFGDGLFFSSIAADLPSNLSGRMGQDLPVTTAHEQLTGRVESILQKCQLTAYTLTGDVCSVCQRCTYPKELCRYPDLMHPCIESHGISIAQLAEHCGIDYYLDGDFALQFSIVFFRK